MDWGLGFRVGRGGFGVEGFLGLRVEGLRFRLGLWGFMVFGSFGSVDFRLGAILAEVWFVVDSLVVFCSL